MRDRSNRTRQSKLNFSGKFDFTDSLDFPNALAFPDNLDLRKSNFCHPIYRYKSADCSKLFFNLLPIGFIDFARQGFRFLPFLLST